MNIAELEAAAFQAWPAVEELPMEAGVLRWAAGVSRRANSLTPASPAKGGAQQVMDAAEDFYFARGLPAIVRVLAEPGGAALDAELAEAGYDKQAPTDVMFKTLPEKPPVGVDTPRQSAVSECQVKDWLLAWYDIKCESQPVLDIQASMLSRRENNYRFLVYRAAGKVLATAMAVQTGSALGIFGVATAPTARRQGLAETLLNELMRWGVNAGASYTYLQVEAANTPAVSLYKKIGFVTRYSYWYRVRSLPVQLLLEQQRAQCHQNTMETEP